MEVTNGDCLKRPRDKNGSFPPRSVVARTCSNELNVRNSLDIVLGLRVARRSDNSDTIPRQSVVETDVDELPVNGATSEHRTVTVQCSLPLPSYQGIAPLEEISFVPTTTKPSTNLAPHTIHATRLDNLSAVELQHELILLDALEQELLRDLRSARQEHDARVAKLTTIGSSFGKPAATALSTVASAAASATLPIATAPLLQQLNSLLHQPCALAAPTSRPTAILKEQCAQQHKRQRLAASAAEALCCPRGACAEAGAMPPPPPRPPSGVLQQPQQQQPQPQQPQQQQHRQAAWDGRGRARLPGGFAPSRRAEAPSSSRVTMQAAGGAKAL
ncbi:hypothetical protein PLESTB_001384600 [Pleodorina starrii]|uniref:Uncharacterized protein n=1 Tax=Pleodorina starrii TaxID=330485 RepID=A0A9W6BV70_9CHLO|nr:hypothetical protein PLESTB_001259800 [Pleodorina starrii]GLC58653.1 hypothetical protein PLESTB_001384600 [Pleodorina starrii]